MNIRDSEIIEHLFAQSGFITVDDPELADLIIINTCSIRAKAEHKVYSLLGELRKNKSNKPSLKIAVTGCVAQQEGNSIFEKMNHVDIVTGTQQIYQLPEMLKRIESGKSEKEISIDLKNDFTIPAIHNFLNQNNKLHPHPTPLSVKKFVNIMQGCNNHCSYCVVPATRGREISRPVADILEEIQILVKNGTQEITLLGQNVNSYGKTNTVADYNVDFSDLLHMVSAINGLKRLRFTTSHPKDLSEKLMRCFAEVDILCSHFHLPVQSGSNSILKSMNRKYTVESYLDKIQILTELRPEIALATDIIIGFPGETDEDFKQTMKLLNTVRFHSSFSFKYSDRPGTRSLQFDNKIDEVVKSERLIQFQERQNQIGLERNREYVGKSMEIMIESISNDSALGRTSTNHIVHIPPTDSIRPGDFINIIIEHAGKHSLNGKLSS
jgi:tRNA-2-methylthio-N6-dimethylallyladenosine synthase